MMQKRATASIMVGKEGYDACDFPTEQCETRDLSSYSRDQCRLML